MLRLKSLRAMTLAIALATSMGALGGCTDYGYGPGYYGPGPGWGGYDFAEPYPVYGYAPYWSRERVYAPTFEVHHGWENHYHGGHHDHFYHAPIAHPGGGEFHHGGGPIHHR